MTVNLMIFHKVKKKPIKLEANSEEPIVWFGFLVIFYYATVGESGGVSSPPTSFRIPFSPPTKYGFQGVSLSLSGLMTLLAESPSEPWSLFSFLHFTL